LEYIVQARNCKDCGNYNLFGKGLIPVLKKINHLGIAVNDLEKAIEIFTKAFNLEVGGIEEVPSQQVKVAFLPIGESRIELLEPTSEDSAVSKFLATRGEGVHHVAFETDCIVDSLKTAEAQGLRFIDKEPRPGAHGTKVAFIHPKSTCGVLIELVEEAAE